jgi:hypothetical protein
MKQKLLFVLSTILLFSCGNPNRKNSAQVSSNPSDTAERIIGTWTLNKEVFKDGRAVVWSGKPTVPQLDFKKNSFYLMLDRITEEKISRNGIPSIQERYKGQYSYKKGLLTLNHLENEEWIKDEFKIEQLDSKHLILRNTKTSKTSQYSK